MTTEGGEKGEGCVEDETHVSSTLGATAAELTESLKKVTIQDDTYMLVCDAGYGFPREKVPRKEKINAIAGQLSNFLKWQTAQQKTFADDADKKNVQTALACVRVVGCPDETSRSTLEARLLEKMSVRTLPDHVVVSCESLEECLSKEFCDENIVYLSPDADESLDPSVPAPKIVVVGLLIDRRVQPNRSKDRALKLNIVSKRWPLEDIFVDISAKEPLNVDCVLEGMQQWWWNSCDEAIKDDKESFAQAAFQAIEHHAKRHPSRPLHLSSC
mmetsp:Transcript_30935/g.51483  ORF Transcript_30935/g.51483 Transcript_30935/m.51483 type:complete len:272 (+) Transcript_30935:304-1119(+)|eukprot:CAMPEP_0178745612 /NCGR_PEP_ID=MMETSP0744-20121128/7387_1 /TAXON_ID=913974 /ORGANISM="Nitzschia punctata, Strain CCMP561" /LENGTH=271 /DNA_ID=CAMNT_0020398805 /DNA_START=2048 /DNA_END=2863 /DNA_ORIENTATION=-